MRLDWGVGRLGRGDVGLDWGVGWVRWMCREGYVEIGEGWLEGLARVWWGLTGVSLVLWL